MKYYRIGIRNGMDRMVSEADVIENALHQEKLGIKPSYCKLDYKTRNPITPPGWLIWSDYRFGCGVAYRREDGKFVILTGWQGDFGIF